MKLNDKHKEPQNSIVAISAIAAVLAGERTRGTRSRPRHHNHHHNKKCKQYPQALMYKQTQLKSKTLKLLVEVHQLQAHALQAPLTTLCKAVAFNTNNPKNIITNFIFCNL